MLTSPQEDVPYRRQQYRHDPTSIVPTPLQQFCLKLPDSAQARRGQWMRVASKKSEEQLPNASPRTSVRFQKKRRVSVDRAACAETGRFCRASRFWLMGVRLRQWIYDPASSRICLASKETRSPIPLEQVGDVTLLLAWLQYCI